MGTLVLSLPMAPAAAHAGFLEQLFGMEPAPSVQPAVPQFSVEPRVRRIPRAPRKPAVVETTVSGRQTPTDLMHDKTLRRGDAVMMKDGMHVYAGYGRAAGHSVGEFVPLDRSALSAKERMSLAAVDATRASVAAKDVGTGATLASGRSASVGVALSEGTVITDARGVKVRYVGP